MRSLLDNRKDLTPQQSMEVLAKYARYTKQDTANLMRKARGVRAEGIISLLFFGALSVYVVKQYYFGYWHSIYPRSVISLQFETTVLGKRQYFAPEIYLKDQERWSKELASKDIKPLSEETLKHKQH